MMRLDGGRRPSARRDRLDDVGIQRALNQEPDVVSHLAGRLLEHVNEGVADATPLLLRVLDPRQLTEEAPRRIHHSQIGVQLSPEGALHLLALPAPQQAVVHQNTGQAPADGALHQRGGHRRIHTAGEAADGPSGPHPVRDLPDRPLDEMAGRPVRPGAADPEQEVLQHLRAARRVHDLRMELHPEQRLGAMPERGHRGVRAPSENLPAGGRHVHPVAVRHPHRGVGAGGEPLEQPLPLQDLDVRPPVFPLARLAHFAAREMSQQLHAVADAEHRNAQIEQRGVRGRGVRIVDGAGAAREDDPRGGKGADPLDVSRRRVDLAVDVSLADPPGDQLRVLRAQVHDQDALRRAQACSRRHSGADVSPCIRSSTLSLDRTTAQRSPSTSTSGGRGRAL